MNLSDWRYAHLAYNRDTDEACMDAASLCSMKVLRAKPGQYATCSFKTPTGVVEAFADAVQIARDVTVPRAAVLVWRHDEHKRVAELLGQFR